MRYDDLMQKVLEILPDATVEDDNEGQLIIYTGLMVVGDAPNFEVVPWSTEVLEDHTEPTSQAGPFDHETEGVFE